MKSGVNQPPDRWLWATCLVIALAALALRIPLLEPRPMHTDEAVNAGLLGEMLAGQTYAYDPRDFHGPAFYFLAAPLLRLGGIGSLAAMEAWQLRLIPALTWSALIFGLPLLRPGLGRVGVLAAAALLALAAPFVYFSTDFIHESLFLFFTVFSVAAGAHFFEQGRRRWAVALGLGLGLMVATKETVALTFAAAGGAWVFSWNGLPRLERRRLLQGGVIAAACAVGVVILFFTSFGANPGGLRDLVVAGGNFTARATGQGHEKPWWTYAQWMFAPNVRALPFSGWAIAALAIVGIVLGRRRPMARFLTLLGGGLFVIYSVIPYKTPWLMLNFLVPFAFVAGIGIDELWKRGRASRVMVFALAGFIGVTFSRESERLGTKFSVDPANPLAYAASSPDGKRLAARVAKLMAGHEADSVQVISADVWPLPWLVRKIPRVGYWRELPPVIDGRVLIASPDFAEQGFAGYEARGFYGVRPDVLVCVFERKEKP